MRNTADNAGVREERVEEEEEGQEGVEKAGREKAEEEEEEKVGELQRRPSHPRAAPPYCK